jgi:hypothetical protein
MVAKQSDLLKDIEIVGQLENENVYRLTTHTPLWAEYQCGESKYRNNGGGFTMKQIVRPLDLFTYAYLGEFNEMISKSTDDLQGVHVIMEPSKELSPEGKPYGGQIILIGWTHDISIAERDFFDALNSKESN